MTSVTVKFNQARAQEAAGDSHAAERGYRDLLGAFPGKTDCLLR